MTMRFFVYGAISEGMLQWTKISPFINQIEEATIQGSVWRLPVGFPALLKEGNDTIPGSVIEVRTSDLLLGLLDQFHGFNSMDPGQSLFQRESAQVYVGGRTQPESVQVYFINPRKLSPTAKQIEGGGWKQNLVENPPLPTQLTERQRTYLVKLSSATGREVVPINDLKLYRELMNLELIVDKGRRLALSKLGQEVVRYLD